MRGPGADDDTADEDDGAAGGGSWLTYRYRLAAGAGADAAGTIKAPSFLTAARRLAEGRLAARLGPEPAHLRLRAAGEEEVLVRVTRAAPGAAADLAVVPPGSHAFSEPDAPGPDAPGPPAPGA